MDVSAISQSSGIASALASGPAPHNHRAAFDAAATLLGLSTDDLRTAVQGGQSLADLAKSKGISQDDLVKAMAGAIQQANPAVSADQAAQIATRIATHVPGPAKAGGSSTAGAGASGGAGAVAGAHGHHHHHHGGGVMSSVSQLLGDSTSDIAADLKKDQSLTDVAKSQGISQDDLVKTIAQAFQKSNPNISSDVATQMATQFATASPQTGSLLDVQA